MEILIVESNRTLVQSLRTRLEADGFTVTTAAIGHDALGLLTEPRFHGILLSTGLPDMKGLQVLRELRNRNLDTPVMLLSMQSAVADRVCGLDSGADDYLVKPFHIDECMARVRRLVRTYQLPNKAPSIFCVADLTVDTEHHIATRSGTRILLSAKESAILEYMVQHQGQALPREDIEAHVPSSLLQPGSAVISVYIHYLRKKLDRDYPVKLLHTVRGNGYVLSAEPPAAARYASYGIPTHSL